MYTVADMLYNVAQIRGDKYQLFLTLLVFLALKRVNNQEYEGLFGLSLLSEKVLRSVCV